MKARNNQSAAATAKADPKKKPPTRRPGRPAKGEPSALSRDMILSLSFQMAKSVPLTELSIVRVAAELGVTPALIHYYIGSRDELTSGIMNEFYRELVESWPPEVGNWKHNLEVVAHAIYRAYLRYPGIVIYIATYNRYELLQLVHDGETDYGLLAFEKFVSTIRQMGLDANRTGILANLVMSFISHSAYLTVTQNWPGQSREFLLDRMTQLNPDEFPNTTFVRDSYVNLNAVDAFPIGLGLIVTALEVEYQSNASRQASAS